MAHLKISQKEIELFVRSMYTYRNKLDEDHPHSDTYVYTHPVSKERRYVTNTIGKMENELKRAMRRHKVINIIRMVADPLDQYKIFIKRLKDADIYT